MVSLWLRGLDQCAKGQVVLSSMYSGHEKTRAEIESRRSIGMTEWDVWTRVYIQESLASQCHQTCSTVELLRKKRYFQMGFVHTVSARPPGST